MVEGSGRDGHRDARPGDGLGDASTLDRFLELSGDLLIVIDRDWRISHVNPAWTAVLGHAPDAVIGKRIAAFMPTRDRREAATMAQLAVRDGGFSGYEARFLHRDGGVRWIHWNVRFDPELDALFCVGHDTTASHLADMARTASEASYRAMFESSMDGMIITRPGRDEIVSMNRAMRSLLRLPDNAPFPIPVETVLDVDDPRYPRAVSERKRTGHFRGELTVLRSDGTRFPAEVSAVQFTDADGETRSSLTVRDVTSRRSLENALEAAVSRNALQAAAMNAAPNGIIIIGEAGTVEWANPAFSKITGYSYEEVVGGSTKLLESEDYDDATYRKLWRAVRSGQTWHDVLVKTRKDGSAYHEELTIAPVRQGQGPITHFVAIKQDVSERIQIRRALEASEQRLRAFMDRSNDVFGVSDNRGSVLYLSDGVEKVLGFRPSELLGAGFGQRVHPDDRPRVDALRALLDAEGFASISDFRFLHKDGTWRWLEGEKHDLRDDSAVDGVLFTIRDVTDRIATLTEIKATRESTFRALGLALEYRDLETKGHTDRVAGLSQRFADVLGFTGDQRQALTWGAYLHDLGKIATPDHILLKPGRLTAEEFEIIRRHTIIGVEMCQDIPFLPEATRELIRSHHERWDGAGYPDGLVGEEIPLKARMFAIADVYDALTSERPYKRAWPVEDAIAELRAKAGSQFDAELVAVFLSEVLSPTGG